MKKLLAYNLSVGIYLLPVAYLALNSTILIMLIKVINLGSDTFGNPIFQKGLQN